MTDQTPTHDDADGFIFDDGATVLVNWSAQECADALNMSAKAFRASMRDYCRANGMPTPGSGGQWIVPVPSDDGERAAYFDALRDAFKSTGARTESFVLKRNV